MSATRKQLFVRHNGRPSQNSPPAWFCAKLNVLPTKSNRGDYYLNMRSIKLWLLVALLFVVITGVVSAAPNLTSNETTSTVLIQADDKVLDASWQHVPPVIDGDLSDWDAYERHILDDQTADYPDPGLRPTPEDLSAWTSIVWDSDYLYIALYVVDDVVYRQSRDWRLDDLAGFSFDMDMDGSSGLYDVSVTVSPDGLITRNDGYRLGIDGVAVLNDEGWQAEFSIPLHEFGAEFLTDAQVGFTWGVRDNDDDGGYLQWLGWAGPTFLTPSPGQGLLRFVDGPTRQWIEVRSGDAGYIMTDSVLNSWDFDDNFGEDAEMGIRAGHGPWHIVMKMEMPELPPDAKIIRGRLHTNVNWRKNEGSFMVRMYRLLRPWDEATVTWFNADAATRWGRPGADQVGVDRAESFIDKNEFVDLGEYVWEFSSEAADWYANPENNHGFLLRAEEGVSVLYRMQSSECGATCAPWFELLVELPPPDAAASDAAVLVR